ncbi:hypothetical protein [Alkaliphilus transvaalensis]|uniref:hypothetical protein n=1 Tax=Alkaliphilus transvaalensis TaxID=114628 RepID=UPI00047B58C3|nr:hypothetical protein [Alkaliphilus transvaalensis]
MNKNIIKKLKERVTIHLISILSIILLLVFSFQTYHTNLRLKNDLGRHFYFETTTLLDTTPLHIHHYLKDTYKQAIEPEILKIYANELEKVHYSFMGHFPKAIEKVPDLRYFSLSIKNDIEDLAIAIEQNEGDIVIDDLISNIVKNTGNSINAMSMLEDKFGVQLNYRSWFQVYEKQEFIEIIEKNLLLGN